MPIMKNLGSARALYKGIEYVVAWHGNESGDWLVYLCSAERGGADTNGGPWPIVIKLPDPDLVILEEFEFFAGQEVKCRCCTDRGIIETAQGNTSEWVSVKWDYVNRAFAQSAKRATIIPYEEGANS